MYVCVCLCVCVCVCVGWGEGAVKLYKGKINKIYPTSIVNRTNWL